MSNNTKHRVRLHNWKNGVLEFIDQVFETFEEALKFVAEKNSYNAKVYDERGHMIHEVYCRPERHEHYG